ncbi:uncharacterized protein LOC132703208 [Cylas formicarius]|uniref:uncharacterized protein LOC132703208 n=1 Tax=Cylas formicarius TaxID=197179 RepID=UPI0029585FB3|nr:uncharacterized protein LOC132703208 [Cylas formicarius]
MAIVIAATLVVVFTCGFALGVERLTTSDIQEILQIGGNVSVIEIPTKSARQLDGSPEDSIENFFKSHEISLEVPLIASTVTLDGRSLDNDEFGVKLRMVSDEDVDGRSKKKRIRRILTPILVVLVLKAITFIPLALGVLGIKTWNALQLSFVSFVVSVVLAVWKFCHKVADYHPPTIIHEAIHDVHPHLYHDHHDHHVVHHDHDYDHVHHGHHDHWDPHYRSDQAQNLAYSAYTPEK